MKVILLAGGYGSRISEETQLKPKPMIEIGERPLLWYIMNHYASYGYKEFCVALGYKGDVIKKYFLDYSYMTGNLSINLATGNAQVHKSEICDWLIHLVDTGTDVMTGGRVRRLREWVGPERFMLTYGDGLSNVNIHRLVEFHRSHGLLATVTAVRPPARFGEIIVNGQFVQSFKEKSQIQEGWINGGFFVFEPQVFDYIDGDPCSLEADVLERLSQEKQLACYRHDDFWQCMDTMRDKRILESLWATGNAPWMNPEV